MYEIDSAGVDPAVKAPGYFLCTHIAMHAESIEINTDSLRMRVCILESINLHVHVYAACVQCPITDIASQPRVFWCGSQCLVLKCCYQEFCEIVRTEAFRYGFQVRC